MLGKNQSVKERNEQFLKRRVSATSGRDYAERISAEKDGELQSEYYTTKSCSLEGCVISVFKEGKEEPTMTFHTHIADHSKQNAASTYVHMCKEIQHLLDNGQLKPGDIFCQDCDGCLCQYRCSTALHLCQAIAHKYNIVIDWLIGAPAHGKGLVDGENATSKFILRCHMCSCKNPHSNESSRSMAPHAMVEDLASDPVSSSQPRSSQPTSVNPIMQQNSLAQVHRDILADPQRRGGVSGHKKHAKREAA